MTHALKTFVEKDPPQSVTDGGRCLAQMGVTMISPFVPLTAGAAVTSDRTSRVVIVGDS